MSRCSGDSLSAATACEPTLPSLTSVRAFARVIEIRPTSELEKKSRQKDADNKEQDFNQRTLSLHFTLCCSTQIIGNHK